MKKLLQIEARYPGVQEYTFRVCFRYELLYDFKFMCKNIFFKYGGLVENCGVEEYKYPRLRTKRTDSPNENSGTVLLLYAT